MYIKHNVFKLYTKITVLRCK